MQFWQTLSFRDLQVDWHNWVNSNYQNCRIWLNNRTWGIMMEVNNDTFLAGDDAPGYFARPKHKKYSMIFIWGNPFSMCRSYDQFFDPSNIPSCAHMYPFKVARLLRMWSQRFDTTSPVLTLFASRSFLILFYLRNLEIHDSP